MQCEILLDIRGLVSYISAAVKKTGLHILLISAVGILAYSNTLSVPFQFDDIRNIVENPAVRNPSLLIDSPRVVAYLTFALNYTLGGLDVAGFHIVNIGIHIINALLVYWLIILTFRTPFFRSSSTAVNPAYLALGTSLLFVSHPVQTQAVTYIVQRLTSLATLFYLASVVSYISFRLGAGAEAGNQKKQSLLPYRILWWYPASFFCAVLAMKTKEIAFTLPVIIALYEFMFFNGPIKKRVLWLIPLLLTMLIIPLSLLGLDRSVSDIISDADTATRLQTDLTRWQYLITQFRVIVTYIRLLVLPVDQNLDYDYPAYRSLLDSEVLFSFLFLIFLAGCSVYLLYRSRSSHPVLRLPAFGIFWFFITMTVESSIIPIVDVIFEHRVYLPSLGAFLAITPICFLFADTLPLKQPQKEKAIVTLLMASILVLTAATYQRNGVWQDRIGLWADVVNKSARKTRPHYQLAAAYKDKGFMDKAIDHYQTVVRLEPGYGEAYNDLGVVYYALGRVDDAILAYEKALLYKPDSAKTKINLGAAYFTKGQIDSAVEQYQQALRLQPDDASAHYNLGNAWFSKGAVDKAVEHYQTAIRLRPDYGDAHFNLGNVYLKKGMRSLACKEYQTVVTINPRDAEARSLLQTCH